MTLRLGNDVPLLAVEGLTKAFGPLIAVGGVDLSIGEGSIHALLGENGAGKSTLVKMLYGTLQPDAGRILINGKPQTVSSPNEARALGIGMVFQHFSLFESMSVAENIALALDHKPTPDEVKIELSAFVERYGLSVDRTPRSATLMSVCASAWKSCVCCCRNPRWSSSMNLPRC